LLHTDNGLLIFTIICWIWLTIFFTLSIIGILTI